MHAMSEKVDSGSSLVETAVGTVPTKEDVRCQVPSFVVLIIIFNCEATEIILLVRSPPKQSLVDQKLEP